MHRVKKIYASEDGTLRSTHNGALVARANFPEHARRLAAAWNAFLEAETTAIENVALRRIRRAYRKKRPEWRQERDRLLRERYAVERRAAIKVVT
jgi:hypothetical protein